VGISGGKNCRRTYNELRGPVAGSSAHFRGSGTVDTAADYAKKAGRWVCEAALEDCRLERLEFCVAEVNAQWTSKLACLCIHGLAGSAAGRACQASQSIITCW
jgi:hypothetical protein